MRRRYGWLRSVRGDSSGSYPMAVKSTKTLPSLPGHNEENLAICPQWRSPLLNNARSMASAIAFVASVRWVPLISAVVKRQQARRGIRVAEYLVEIDYTVILATRADPVVDRLTVPTKNSDRFVITEVDRLRLIP